MCSHDSQLWFLLRNSQRKQPVSKHTNSDTKWEVFGQDLECSRNNNDANLSLFTILFGFHMSCELSALGGQ